MGDAQLARLGAADAEFGRLVDVRKGLPDCSLIVFRHMPKTGGTSVVRLFEDLQRDLQWTVSSYWTACYRGRASYLAQGRLRWLRGLRMALSNRSRGIKWRSPLDSAPWKSGVGTMSSSSLLWLPRPGCSGRTFGIESSCRGR